MAILVEAADCRVRDANVTDDDIVVVLFDGRSVSAPLAWFPRLLAGTPQQRSNWVVSGGGYALHWPDLDEDISTEGLLRGAPAPVARA